VATVSDSKSPRLMRRPEVLAKIGLASSTLYEMTAAGEFPAPIPIGRQAVGWLESEVDAWIKKRVELRDSQPRKRAVG
jgi:prophage regulatory protein